MHRSSIPDNRCAPIGERLKHATSEVHQRVEALVGLPPSIAAHVAALERFFALIEPWEARVMPAVADHPSLADRLRKTAWLRADLEHFGRSEAELAALPRCSSLPRIESLSEALGSMYVFEGATLGGQIIARHLEHELGLADGAGYRFFRAYGADVPARWLAFKQTLEAHASPDNRERIVASAVTTFECLYDWFTTAPCKATRAAPR
ncbi:MAG: biliverdin-producing heme oxygenase [Planctomycetota bacterium]|nr:MAG: biliverdin-producing heme oxygenase [Planctomycetota bacterium]